MYCPKQQIRYDEVENARKAFCELRKRYIKDYGDDAERKMVEQYKNYYEEGEPVGLLV